MFYKVTDGHGSANLKHNPLNALVAPRPIAWVSTRGKHGSSNLAPFSYFNLVSLDPPILMFSPNEKDTHGAPKDTLRNIRETQEFVVNVVPWRLREAMNMTSSILKYGDSEFELAGLAEAPSTLLQAPRIQEAPAALECQLFHIMPLPTGSGGRQSHAVFGEIVGVYIDANFINNGIVDVLKIAPLARLGGVDYTAVERIETIPRPPGD
jgi:flavin reductase (DIM6/NTAB) family NADH-FMN oxidoreductase RutF